MMRLRTRPNSESRNSPEKAVATKESRNSPEKTVATKVSRNSPEKTVAMKEATMVDENFTFSAPSEVTRNEGDLTFAVYFLLISFLPG